MENTKERSYQKKRLGQKSFGFKKKQRFYAVAFCMVAIDLVK
jgi:hypothetical protein